MSDRTDDNKFIFQIKITDNDDLHNSKKDDSMKRATIIGVMGGGEASPENMDAAYRLGTLIAKQGWILLNGGRNVGIMEASAKGAWDQGGLTIGIFLMIMTARHRNILKFLLLPEWEWRETVSMFFQVMLLSCVPETQEHFLK